MRVNARFTVAASELVVQTSRRFTALTLPFICWLAVQSCPVQMFLAWAVQHTTTLLVRPEPRLKSSTLRPELS
jgi:hypothetical protein